MSVQTTGATEKIVDLSHKHNAKGHEVSVGNTFSEVVVSFKKTETKSIASYTKTLEEKKKELKIEEINIKMTTLEEVFVKIGEKQNGRKAPEKHDLHVSPNIVQQT